MPDEGENGSAPAASHEEPVVWVLTADEYDNLKTKLPNQHYALVLRYICGDFSGCFDKLGLSTSRRLGIFLFAHLSELKDIVMIDDNIEKVCIKGNEQEAECNWQQVCDVFKSLRKNTACLSVVTHSYKAKDDIGRLGSKMFLLNMEKIRTKSPDLKDIFILLPLADGASLWGEDYYFQLMLEEIFPQNGYQIADKDKIYLIRSAKNRNAFLANNRQDITQPVAKNYSFSTILALKDRYQWLLNVTDKINTLIASNITRVNTKQQLLQRTDLLSAHAKANHTETAPQALVTPVLAAQDLKSFVSTVVFNDIHYPHQKNAISSLKNLTGQVGHMVMATGTGKTRVQCELARMAYHLAKVGECVVIVTPQLGLVEQFYRDFIAFSGIETARQSLAIPKSAIVKVSSSDDSVHVGTLLNNQQIKRQKSIFIFCEKSFKEFLPHWKEFNPVLCLLDEYHVYKQTAQMVIDDGLEKVIKIGLTATPPSDVDFKQQLFHFSIKEALAANILTPIVADSIMGNFSESRLKALVQNLPAILERPHPRGSDNQACTLKDMKGVIYLPSIAECESTQEYLSKQGIECQAIHSQNKDCQNDIAAYKRNKKGILLACEMLRIGFDDCSIGWIIIGQDVKNDDVLIQIIGRVMRKDREKLGYVLAFDEVCKKIRELTGAESLQNKLSSSYLKTNEQNIYSHEIVIKRSRDQLHPVATENRDQNYPIDSIRNSPILPLRSLLMQRTQDQHILSKDPRSSHEGLKFHT